MQSDLPCYLLTFRTYGTWLHGDARGSVDRRRNGAGQAIIPPNPAWEQHERALMKDPPVEFSNAQREVVTEAIREICKQRGVALYAINARTNHVHVVAGATIPPETMINDFKAFATRALRKAGLIGTDAKVWFRGGSVRLLHDARAVEAACLYVVEGQGATLGEIGDEVSG